MARAKRTDRAEARRKYRAYLQAQEEAESAAANAVDETPAPAARRSLFGRAPSTAPAAASATPARPRAASGTAAPAPTPGVGMGFFRAMGAAYKPVRYRDDIRYLPTLFTRGVGLWAGIALAVVATVVVMVDSSHDFWVGLASLCIGAMPLGVVMIVGVLTHRAAWLAGLIAGGVSGVLGWIVILAKPENWYDTTLTIPDLSTRQGFIVEYLTYGLAFGALFAAASAWYRRFLTLAMPPNPNRGSKRAARNARPAAKKTAKPTR